MVNAAKAKGFNEDLTQTKPVTETPAAASGTEKTETPAASETAKAEEKPAATTEPEFTFEQDGFVGAKDLAAKLDANPALKAALPEDLRNEIMANARLAERGSKYDEFFASPAEAKVVTETAQMFATFSDAFNQISADAEKGTSAFIQKLIENSVIRDDKGEPIKDDKGFFKTDGTANKFVETLGKRWLNRNIVNAVKKLGDENVQAALDLVMESIGLSSTAKKTENQDPAIAAREAELTQRETAFKTEQENSRKEARTTYSTALEGDLSSLYDTEVGKVLSAATGLDKLTREAVEGKLETAIRSAIKANVAYQTRKSQLQARPMTPARRAAEVALAKEFFADNLVRLARPIFKEANITVGKKAAERDANSAARVDNARSEVNGGKAVTPNPGTSSNVPYAQQVESARAEFKQANGGKDPSDSELNIHMMLRAAKAKGLAA